MKAEYRANRTRAKIHGTSDRPRLTVHISNLHITAQVIDDDKKTTLAYATTVGSKLTGTKTEKAAAIGKEIAEKAKTAKVKTEISAIVDDLSSDYSSELVNFIPFANSVSYNEDLTFSSE